MKHSLELDRGERAAPHAPATAELAEGAAGDAHRARLRGGGHARGEVHGVAGDLQTVGEHRAVVHS
ncbi:MAG: hypothetical protein ACK559_22980, partial [bacterium]